MRYSFVFLEGSDVWLEWQNLSMNQGRIKNISSIDPSICWLEMKHLDYGQFFHAYFDIWWMVNNTSKIIV